MLPNHSAYHIAENFRTLEALYPGRVDCGIGTRQWWRQLLTVIAGADAGCLG